jgi:membrane-bound lytic murein transglycosylase B
MDHAFGALLLAAAFLAGMRVFLGVLKNTLRNADRISAGRRAGKETRAMRYWAIVLPMVLMASAVRADVRPDEAVAERHGWRYLVDKLTADGVPRAQAATAFADPRVPPFDGLSFALAPREAPARYRRLQSPATVRAARQCRARHAEAFAAAEAREGVPASLVAAIVQVESACGRTTGASPVFHRLARLAMANEPANVANNLHRHLRELAGGRSETAVAEQVQRRAAYLEDTFYPEMRALFTMAERLGVDVLAIQGSGAGAFGFPQFLPTSYLRYGVDGNGDGRVSLYDMTDAAASCARFLSQNGWRAGLSPAEQRRVIWQYNRSEPYIDTILALQRRIDEPSDRVPRLASRERGGSRTPARR